MAYIPFITILSRKKAREQIMNMCKTDLYTGEFLHGKCWTLEHIVPQSRFTTKKNINDLFNLSAVDSRLNSSRGNKKFGNVSGNKNIYGCRSSKYLFCPTMGKGEVSRSVAYMFDLYGYDIDMEKVIDIDTLLEWNDLYPPTDLEKEKNEIVYEIQNSYNKFVEDNTLNFDPNGYRSIS